MLACRMSFSPAESLLILTMLLAWLAAVVLSVANLGLTVYLYAKKRRKIPLLLNLGGIAGYAGLTYWLTQSMAGVSSGHQATSWDIFAAHDLPVIVPALVIGHFICLFVYFRKTRAKQKKSAE